LKLWALRRSLENGGSLAERQVLGDQGNRWKEGGTKKTENQPDHAHRNVSVRVLSGEIEADLAASGEVRKSLGRNAERLLGGAAALFKSDGFGSAD
jgi:hypothetical protein